MRLDLLNLPALSASAVAARLLPEQRVGAILEAIAVRDAKSGQLWLDIGGQRHPARLASGDAEGPADGERLQLRVLRNSPVLALETINTHRPAAQNPEAAIISDALRRYVPRQASAAPLFANIAWLATRKSEQPALPQPVTQALTKLWQAAPTAQALADPAKLAQAVQGSGAFFEQQLANGAAPVNDLKGLLLTLRNVLREFGAHPEPARADAGHGAPPLPRTALTALPAAPASVAVLDAPEQQMNELSRQTDSTLARLTTTQLTSVASDGPVNQPLLIELPVRIEDRANILRLRIERDGAHHDAEGRDAWTVEAALDLGVAGGLHARVSLQGRRIGVQFRAESPDVVRQLFERSAELEAMLRESGLQIDRVVCLHGLPKGDADPRAVRLLDVRA